MADEKRLAHQAWRVIDRNREKALYLVDVVRRDLDEVVRILELPEDERPTYIGDSILNDVRFLAEMAKAVKLHDEMLDLVRNCEIVREPKEKS